MAGLVAPLDDPTPDEIEAAASAMYQGRWTGPNAPGEAMKEVWRSYARRCLAGFLEARRAGVAHEAIAKEPRAAEAEPGAC